MTQHETLADASEEYFRKHPEQITLFLEELFEDFAQDADTPSLLEGLRIIARAKGVTQMATHVGISRQGLQKALSHKGNPRLENINAIIGAMGYRLTISPASSV